MYLEELPKYRDTVAENICTSTSILKLLELNSDSTLIPSQLPHNIVFPYSKIIDKTTNVGVYICFDLRVPRVIGRTFSDFYIDIYIIAHERRLKTDFGLITDLIASEIDKLINGSKCFGLGRVELKSLEPFSPAEKFYGTALIYRTVDFNRG